MKQWREGNIKEQKEEKRRKGRKNRITTRKRKEDDEKKELKVSDPFHQKINMDEEDNKERK